MEAGNPLPLDPSRAFRFREFCCAAEGRNSSDGHVGKSDDEPVLAPTSDHKTDRGQKATTLGHIMGVFMGSYPTLPK
jgi:hypothetical protein